MSQCAQLPPQLVGDIVRALNAAASTASGKVEARLKQAQVELADLAAVGESNEARIDELSHELEMRTSQRDSMAGQLSDRTNETTELKTALLAALEKVGALERELHVAQVKAQGAQAAGGRVEEVRESTDPLLSKMQRELDQARTGQAKAEHRATEAEKLVARTQAHIDDERSAKTVLSAHVGELQAAVKSLEGSSARAAAAEASTAGLTNQVAWLNETVAMLRSMVPTPARDARSSPVGT